MSEILYGQQHITQDDIDAVQAVLTSRWLTQGPMGEQFEQAVAQACGAHYAVAVSSATAALHIACLGLGLQPGGRVWTSPNTFVASANCALYCGARVDFVDIDADTLNMSMTALQDKLERADKQGLLPDIVIPVHFAGQSCDMSTLKALSDQYGFQILEDAAHAIGGRYQQQPVGHCTFSAATVFSFHPVKMITTGEGGMVVTNNEALYQRLLRLRSHGITRDSRFVQGKLDGDWAYQQLELGFNYRMTDMQAALGYSQLQRLSAIVECRQYWVQCYRQALAPLPLRCIVQHADTHPAWHLKVIQLNDPMWRAPLFTHMRAHGIQAHVHYQPVYLQPFYQQLGFVSGYCPQAEDYYARALTLPLHPALTQAEFDRVIEELTRKLVSITNNTA